jgi:thiamine-monophosphate kinase
MSSPRRPARGFDEARAVALFARAFAQPGARGIQLGIGDDAAVLGPARERLVWTVDASVEGTHFERAWLTLEDVGFRAFQAAASDLAAMGARPLAALSALTLPRGFSARELARLAAGQAEAARACRCPVVGGNVARGNELSITTSVLGVARRPLLRDGARPGEDVWLVGEVGLAAAGLELLRRGGKRPAGPAAASAIATWRRPRALIARGKALAGLGGSAIDVSDGLALDVTRLARASGCRVVLEETALVRALPRSLVQLSTVLGRSALELALHGGEDYALVATGRAARRPTWARRIGRCERGHGGFLERPDGSRPALGGGFDHFAP